MWIDQSYWGVQGWEITSTAGSGDYGSCVQVSSSTAQIHHIVLANNVFNTCSEFGASSYLNSGFGVDYEAYVGNIAYNSSGVASYVCGSGLSINQPINYDTLPGTHIYLAGNFAWGSFNANPCGGYIAPGNGSTVTPTDVEGIIIDTPSASHDGLLIVESDGDGQD
jgi:hypothetical protein